MELEKQVVSLELSRMLKELGVKQESLYYWVKEKRKWVPKHNHGVTPISPSAFAVAELGEMLPKQVFNVYTAKAAHNARQGKVVADRTFWCWRYKEKERASSIHDMDEFFAETEADARAKMLIYLLENNLLPS